jgi:hypothetical protein
MATKASTTPTRFPPSPAVSSPEPELRTLWPKLLFIEQPWHRDVALSPAVGAALQAWPERPPIIIDESDARKAACLPRSRSATRARATKTAKAFSRAW